MLARQVDVVRVPREEPVRLVEHRRHVEELVVRDPDGGAPRDRPHRVAATAEAGQPRGVEPVEHLGERPEPEVVELDVLPRRQLRLALSTSSDSRPTARSWVP